MDEIKKRLEITVDIFNKVNNENENLQKFNASLNTQINTFKSELLKSNADITELQLYIEKIEVIKEKSLQDIAAINKLFDMIVIKK